MTKYQNLLLVSIPTLLIFLVYYPGLSGPFMFDDWSALTSLFTSIKYSGFWFGILDGGAGPTGRPIALFTFALQHAQWPEPYSFKLVNVIIHLFNTVLVGVFTFLFSRSTEVVPPSRYLILAITVASIWAIQPIQVSTVLYVVQRMVLLSVFFTLLGMCGYLWGRKLLISGKQVKAYIILSLSVSICGLLSIASKEIGLLIVLYIFVIEITINYYQPYKSWLFSLWKTTFILLPIVLFAIYIIINTDAFLVQAYVDREFDMLERLLTQPRILWSYVGEILLPRASNITLFHDDIQVSTGLFAPGTTCIAIAAWLVLLLICYKSFHKSPLVSFCVLWFLLGHAMESSFLPLELYFDHRNYLPSFSLVFGIVILYIYGYSHIKEPYIKKVGGVLAIGYVVLVSSVTYGQSKLWGNELEYALTQSDEHPNSLRARSVRMSALSSLGQNDKAYEELKALLQDYPNESALLAFEIDFACIDEKYKLAPIKELELRLKTAKFNYTIIKFISDFIDRKLAKQCDFVDSDYVIELANILAHNELYFKRKSSLLNYSAVLSLQQGDIDRATQFLQTIPHRDTSQCILLARLLATKGKLNNASIELNNCLKTLRIDPQYFAYKQEITELQQAIENEINSISSTKTE